MSTEAKALSLFFTYNSPNGHLTRISSRTHDKKIERRVMDDSGPEYRPLNSYEIQEKARHDARQAFWSACQSNEKEQIHNMLKTGPLTLTDVLNYLRNEENLNYGMVPFLLGLGVNANEVTPHLRKYHNRAMLEVLIRHGWDVQNKGPQLLIDKIDDREWVEWIVGKGIDLNKPTNHNHHIRRLGLHRGLGWQSDPARLGERDYTVGCLNLAAVRGDIELFDYFVSRGADPLRSIALHRVSQCQDPKATTAMVVHLIEKYKMDPMASDKCNGLRWIYGLGGMSAMNDMGTPMEFAMTYNNPAAIEALYWYSADSSGGVCWAASIGSLRVLRMFLEGGARDDAGKGAFQAVEFGQEEALKICIEFGATEDDYTDATPGRRVPESDSD